LGTVDFLQLRRTILANLPSDYIGFNQYWQAEENEKLPAKSATR